MNTMDYKTERARCLERFGANVRRLRTKGCGLSQEGLADLTRLHRTQIGKIEQGEVEPRLITLLILANGLGVAIGDLVAGIGAPVERRPSPPGDRRPSA